MRYLYWIMFFIFILKDVLFLCFFFNILLQAVKNCNSDMITHLPKIHMKPDHLNGFISIKSIREIEELIGSLQLIPSHKALQLKRRLQATRQISFVSTDSFEENKRLGFQRIPSIQKNDSIYLLTSRNIPPALLQHSYQPHRLGKTNYSI